MAPAPPFVAAKYHGGPQSEINRIVMHGTVSPTVDGGALAVARYFQNPPGQTSAHYIVDPSAEYQCVYDHVIAWHDGTNTNSIGVELCDPVDGPAGRWGDGPHQAMLVRAAALVRALCDSYGVPAVKLSPTDIRAGHRGICGHVDMRDAFPGSTTHYDPGPDFPWAQFMSLVAGSPTPAPPTITTSNDEETTMLAPAGVNSHIVLPCAGRPQFWYLYTAYGRTVDVHQVDYVMPTDHPERFTPGGFDDGSLDAAGFHGPNAKTWAFNSDKPGPTPCGVMSDGSQPVGISIRYSSAEPFTLYCG